MTMHLHQLTGCSPTPLALYLKALGVLRLVSEQTDSSARGWWQDEHFCLLTELDHIEFETFFLERYSPTPFTSPWNKGCGFFKANDPGLIPLEESVATRFAAFREGITQARRLLDRAGKADAAIRAIKDRTKTTKTFQDADQRETLKNSFAYKSTLTALHKELDKNDISPEDIETTKATIATLQLLVSDADKPPNKAEANQLKASDGYKRILRVAEKEFKLRKASLLPDCRREWRGLHAQWMAAGVVLDEQGSPQYPSLLGTGGNDGNLDFTNNAMQRIGDLFDLASKSGIAREASGELLRQAFWSQPATGLSKDAIGQFFPGSGGGPNSSTGADGDPLINPWDFVLMMEGSILFSARATRRLDPNAITKASAPFVVHSHAAGHSSPGDENAARGEQWMPMWSKPATYGDVTTLFGDARLQLGRQTVNRPIDAARAVSRLGVARGIDAFTRYGYLERNGQSTLAVPLGRIRVCQRPRSHLIDDIATWLDRLQRLARDKHAPARLIHAERKLADTVFAVLTHDDTPERWQAVLEAAVNVESFQSGGTAINAGPIPGLQPAWIAAMHDGSPEMRLALSIGSAAAGFTRKQRPFDSIRHHWLPLERGAYRFQMSDKRLVHDPRVVARGRDPIADCGEIVRRRLIEAQKESRRNLPLRSAWGCAARLSDLALLLAGSIDLNRVMTLGRGLMALRWDQWSCDHLPISRGSDAQPDEPWLALRLACLPWPIADGLNVPAEPSIINRLLSGDGTAAVRIAASRLRASGLRLPFQSALADATTARLWAAALVFPISHRSAHRAVDILVPTFFGDSHA